MSGHCENCGTRMSDGFCPNCEESAFIAETQAEFLPDLLSEEFQRDLERGRVARDRRAVGSPAPTGITAHNTVAVK